MGYKRIHSDEQYRHPACANTFDGVSLRTAPASGRRRLRTEAIFSLLIPGRPFTTRATVEIETPAASATIESDIVKNSTAIIFFVNEIIKELAT